MSHSHLQDEHLIECKKQYVGEIQNPLHVCLNGPGIEVTLGTKELLSQYSCPLQNPGPLHKKTSPSWSYIEKMRSQDPSIRKKRESYCIHHLKSLSFSSGMDYSESLKHHVVEEAPKLHIYDVRSCIIVYIIDIIIIIILYTSTPMVYIM